MACPRLSRAIARTREASVKQSTPFPRRPSIPASLDSRFRRNDGWRVSRLSRAIARTREASVKQSTPFPRRPSIPASLDSRFRRNDGWRVSRLSRCSPVIPAPTPVFPAPTSVIPAHAGIQSEAKHATGDDV